jgi:hypothetical protein
MGIFLVDSAIKLRVWVLEVRLVNAKQSGIYEKQLDKNEIKALFFYHKKLTLN